VLLLFVPTTTLPVRLEVPDTLSALSIVTMPEELMLDTTDAPDTVSAEQDIGCAGSPTLAILYQVAFETL